MDENKTFTLVLDDGTAIQFQYDNAGNYTVEDASIVESFTPDNTNDVKIMYDGHLVSDMGAVMLRGVTTEDGHTVLSVSPKTPEEKLREENDMLIECILEMSEIIYGE